MTPRFDVLSYGTIGMDVILQVPHWPSSDVSTHAATSVETMGGKAANTATHLAAWGFHVGLTGTIIGDDTMGNRAIAELNRISGIDVELIERRPGLKSMYCVIFVRPDGERAIVAVHTEGIFASPPTKEMVASAKVLTLDLYGGDERVVAARLAHEQGMPVIVGDVRTFDHAVLPFTTTAIASQAELRQTYPGLSAEECAQRFLAAGAKAAILTDGPGEVLVIDTDGAMSRFRPPQVTPVDTTGAGDAFRAGVVFGQLKGYSTARSAMVGAAAGSLAIERIGAATDPASPEEVLSLAEQLAAV